MPTTWDQGGFLTALVKMERSVGWQSWLSRTGVFLFVLHWLWPLVLARATVLHSREEALTLAFPEAERVETRTFTLTAEQAKRVETLATTPWEAKPVTVYIGHKGEQVLGYAFLDSRTVRTLPATFLVVLSPAGVVQHVRILTFHEPEEYLPLDRWLRQFEQQPLSPDLQLHKNIHGIAGATLSSQAVTNAVRQALALFQLLFQEGQ
ncbi:MAG TPA: FMN-binding protein [Candidatus Binatia bacterium]|nr:FMN-binding protein [Candidatus Binatia bacterium]